MIFFYFNFGLKKKRSNANDYNSNKSSKNRDVKPKQQQQSLKESKTITDLKSNKEELTASIQVDNQTKRDTDITNNSNENIQQTKNDERPNLSTKASSVSSQKV